MAAPVFTNLDGDIVSFLKGHGAISLDAAGTGVNHQGLTPLVVGLTDGDSTDFDNGVLTVSVTDNAVASEDLLSLASSVTIPGSPPTIVAIALSGTTAGSDVSVGGTIIGTLANDIGAGNDLVVNLDSNANAANVQTLVGALQYENTNAGDLSTNNRTVSINLTDGDGDTSATQDITVNITTPAPGEFTDSGLTVGGSTSFAVALGDMDGDGDLDMVFATNYANTLWLNDGSGGFTNSGLSLGTSYSNDVSLGDLNGDGYLDMVFANNGGTPGFPNNNAPNKVWLSDGSGGYSDSGQSLSDFNSQGVTLGDLDGDGDLDMVFVNSDQQNTLWLNDGSGRFGTFPNQATPTPNQYLFGSENSAGVAFGDLDGFGNLDMVVANAGGDANTVWLGAGGGFSTLGAEDTLGSADSRDVALGDVDGDGVLDMIVANGNGGTAVWLGNGFGSFGTSSVQVLAGSAQSVSLGDVDGDGDLDIVVGSPFGQAGKVWLNDGSGNFGATPNQFVGNDIALGDLDGDGDLDVAIASGNTGGSSVYLNNSAPAFTSAATFSIDENTTTVGTVAATDSDGDTVTFSLSGGADQTLFDIDTTTGELTFKSAPDFETPGDAGTDNVYDIEVTADDGNGGTTVQTIAITVGDVAEAPTFTSAATFSVDENTTAVGTVTATDLQNDTVTFSLSGGADQTLFDIDTTTGELTFKSAPDYEAPGDAGTDNVYDVEVTADDGNGGTTVQTIAITMDDVAEAPTFTSAATFSVDENTTAVGTVTATDLQNDTVTFSLSGGADQTLFDIDTTTGELTFLSAPDFETPGDAGTDNVYDIEVTADDGNGGTTVQTIAITVGDVSEAPKFTSAATFSMDENTTAVGTVITTDPEGDTVTFSLTGGADQALFDIDTNTGEFGFISAPDFETPGDAGTDNVYDIEVTADDGNGGTTVQAIAITVGDAPEAPVFTSATAFSMDENTTAAATVVATDPEGDTVTFSLTGGADQALFDIDTNTGELSFIVTPDFEAPGDVGVDNVYDVEVTASDGNGGTTKQDIAITVTDVSEGGGGSPTPTNELVLGASSNDSLVGGEGNDTIAGFEGDDIILGGEGNDELRGGQGNDELYGSTGNDTIYSGQGDDTLQGGEGNDLVIATGGNNVLLGGKGDDVIIGSSGNDLIRGGNGTDTLTGGDGVDIFQFTTGQSEVTEMGADQITDFVGGVDQIDTPGVAGTAGNFSDLGSQSSFDSALAAATTAISTATGVIYVETEIGGVHYLFSDDDGDGTIDMAIQVGNDFGFADIV